MGRARAATILFSFALFLLPGCLGRPASPLILPERTAEQRLLQAIDTAVADAGVGNAATSAVAGYPFLRIDRLQEALFSRAVTAGERQSWLDRSYRLARTGREREIRNLPAAALTKLLHDLPGIAYRTELLTAAADAATRWHEATRPTPELWETLATRVKVPDDYATWMRWFGYPLAAIPVRLLGDAAFADFIDWHARPAAALENDGELILYRPDEGAPGTGLDGIPRDALGLLHPDAGQLQRLAAHYAPVLVQETVADYDRLGRFRWTGDTLQLDTGAPAGYYYLSHALVGARVFPQLNYVFWHPARSGPKAPLIERGRFDGLTIRLTLREGGSILMADIMNNCGCYHFFLPRAEVLEQPESVIGIEPLTPRLLPAGRDRQLPPLRIMSGWHQVEYLYEQDPEAVAATGTYQMIPYGELESLPAGQEGHRSVFDSCGILTGSERIEPYLLFAMGIPEVGAMRQRGNHPIRLIGREHFDNPRLFERYFDFKPAISTSGDKR